MQTTDVLMARVYLTEGEHKLKPLLKRLHEDAKVRGVTVFRGVCGYGSSGAVHEAHLLDLSLDLPLVVEFFDTQDRVNEVLDELGDLIRPGHIVTWSAKLHG
ncbi:MAG: DUF190 domain-containing protein [Chromatiales bacterium]|nr:DUF190 domain-containing protein [Chromatiales bacterium]